nr:MAG TPA: hypothetical protein [Bacteriophage sp.]
MLLILLMLMLSRHIKLGYLMIIKTLEIELEDLLLIGKIGLML